MSELDKMVGAYLSRGQWQELDAIKTYHGITANADAVRFLIRQEARRVSAESPLFAVPDAERERGNDES